VHGVGGTLGAILTGVFADESVNSVVGPSRKASLVEQLKAVGHHHRLERRRHRGHRLSSSRPSSAASGRRPRSSRQGLDIAEHGEEGYILTLNLPTMKLIIAIIKPFKLEEVKDGPAPKSASRA
jgi:Amt family ammonium transporter